MADELLPYYEKELAFIRQMGAEFAREHPKIAGRLGISADTIEDPHVSRLIEAFAYLNARIQHKLDDDFPELSDALLSVLFPHYQRPFPSVAIAQFNPDKEQLDAAYTVDKNTLLQTEQFKGETCRFKTIYPVEMLPVTITDAALVGRPFTTPGSNGMHGCASVLKISFTSFSTDFSFGESKPDKFRLYLKGQSQHVHPLYRMLLGECEGIVLASPDDEFTPVSINAAQLTPVGFGTDEGLLPYPEASFLGYRLLTEYFIFPEKFMFVDIAGISHLIPDTADKQLDFYLYLKNTDVELEHNISAATFALNCTPTINLFEHRADPIKLDHTQLEYQVVPDVRRPKGYEVYSVETVSAVASSGKTEKMLPFYGITHDRQQQDNNAFWFPTRRDAKLNNYERDNASDMFISLVDLDFNPHIPDDRTLQINTLCSNRDLPAKLPYNLDQPKLQCVDGAPPCDTIRFITQPTAAIRPPLRNRARWRLISHLNLNHLSITGSDNPAEALREIFRLYDFKESSVSRAQIESVIDVDARSISAPLTIDGRATLCRGIEVEVTLDDSLLTGSSNYLFASVIEHFFGLYCSVNSFTRVLVKLKSKEGYLKKCAPRAGSKVLL